MAATSGPVATEPVPTRPVPTEPFHRGGEGEPLVLLHGITMSWPAWRPVLGAFEAHHDVLAPTLAGHRGGVPWPDGVPVTIDGLADALERQLDEAGLDTVHAAGNSLGGWLALELARRGRARSCVALSPAGAWRTPTDMARLIAFFRLAMRMGTPDWLRRLARRPAARKVLLYRIMNHADRIPEHDVDGFFDDIAECTMLAGFLDNADADGGLPAFTPTCPTRIAWSADDRIVPWARFGVPMRERVKGADLRSLPGCGHVPMWDDPELVARTVLQVTAPDAVTVAT